MAAIPGTILASKISPGDDTATFPTHVDVYGQGGHMSLARFAELSSVPEDRQKIGMQIAMQDTGTVWALTATGASPEDQVQKIMTIDSSGVVVHDSRLGGISGENIVTIASYGAIPGSTSTAAVTANTMALRSAYRALSAQGGGTILIPDGEYYLASDYAVTTDDSVEDFDPASGFTSAAERQLSAALQPALTITSSNITIKGVSKLKSKLLQNVPFTIPIYINSQSENQEISGVHIRDLYMGPNPAKAYVRKADWSVDTSGVFGHGCMVVASSPYNTNHLAMIKNLTIDNCTFELSLGVFEWNGVIGARVTNSDFLCFKQPTPISHDLLGFSSTVPIRNGAGPISDMIVANNTYNGSVYLDEIGGPVDNLFHWTITSGDSSAINASDGLAWFTAGSNFVFANNTVRNFALEGIQVAPTSIITGNTFSSRVSSTSQVSVNVSTAVTQNVGLSGGFTLESKPINLIVANNKSYNARSFLVVSNPGVDLDPINVNVVGNVADSGQGYIDEEGASSGTAMSIGHIEYGVIADNTINRFAKHIHISEVRKGLNITGNTMLSGSDKSIFFQPGTNLPLTNVNIEGNIIGTRDTYGDYIYTDTSALCADSHIQIGHNMYLDLDGNPPTGPIFTTTSNEIRNSTNQSYVHFNNQQRSDGTVGFGTPNPDPNSKLTVTGSICAVSDASNVGVRLATRAAEKAYITLAKPDIDRANGYYWELYQHGGSSPGENGSFNIFNGANGVDSVAMSILSSNGFAGFGTTNPQYRLTVAGDISASNRVGINTVDLPYTLSMTGSSYMENTRNAVDGAQPDFAFISNQTTDTDLISAPVVGIYKKYTPNRTGPQTVLSLTGRWVNSAPAGPAIDFHNFVESAPGAGKPFARIAALDHTGQWGGGLHFYTRNYGVSTDEVQHRMMLDARGRLSLNQSDPLAVSQYTFSMEGSSYHGLTRTDDLSTNHPDHYFYGAHTTSTINISTPVLGVHKRYFGDAGVQSVVSLSGRWVGTAPSGPGIQFWNEVDGDGVRPNHLGTYGCVDNDAAWGGEWQWYTHQTGASTNPVELTMIHTNAGDLSTRGNIYGQDATFTNSLCVFDNTGNSEIRVLSPAAGKQALIFQKPGIDRANGYYWELYQNGGSSPGEDGSFNIFNGSVGNDSVVMSILSSNGFTGFGTTIPSERVTSQGNVSASGDYYGGLPVEIGAALSPELSSAGNHTVSVQVSALVITAPWEFTLETVKGYVTNKESTGTVQLSVLSAFGHPDEAVPIGTIIITGTDLKGSTNMNQLLIAEDSFIRFDISAAAGNATGLKVWLLGSRHRSV